MDQMIQKDTSSVYQSHKVCNKCYEIYEKTEELRKLEIMFAEAMEYKLRMNMTLMPQINSNLRNRRQK